MFVMTVTQWVVDCDLARGDKSFSNTSVASSIAGGDEVSDAAALQEGGRGNRTGRAEEPCKRNHLHQTQTDYCRLGVITEAKAVAETCTDCHNVLEGNYIPITSCLSGLLPHIFFISDHAQMVLLTASVRVNQSRVPSKLHKSLQHPTLPRQWPGSSLSAWVPSAVAHVLCFYSLNGLTQIITSTPIAVNLRWCDLIVAVTTEKLIIFLHQHILKCFMLIIPQWFWQFFKHF